MGLYGSHHLVDAALGTVETTVEAGIGVYLEDEVPFGIVRWQGHQLQRVLQVCVPCAHAAARAVGVDNEVAHGIVAASGTHGIDETLCVTVDSIVGRSCSSGIILSAILG